MSTLRKAGIAVAAFIFLAGVVFVALPIAAIPDEALLGIAGAVGALVWIVQEVRSLLADRETRRQRQSIVDEYEQKLKALASGAPDQVREALEELRQATVKALLAHLGAMHPYAFEKNVGAVLERLGFSNVVVTQSTRDHGVDVRASYKAGSVAPVDFCVQVKRADTVGAPDVQSIRGSCAPGEHAILITSGRFTPDAIREAAQMPRVTLVSGAQLADIMMNLGIGARREDVALHRPALDSLPFGAPEQEPEPSPPPEPIAVEPSAQTAYP